MRRLLLVFVACCALALAPACSDGSPQPPPDPTAVCKSYVLDDAASGARFFVLQPKVDVASTLTYDDYRAWIEGLVDTQVTPCLSKTKPNVIAFPEETSLVATFIGSRADGAREQTTSFGAFFQVLNAYPGPSLYYDQQFGGGLGFGEKLTLGVTDTVWRAFSETMSDVAKKSGAYVIASANVSGTIDRSTDPTLVGKLGDPDLASDYVYVAKDSAVYNTAFVFAPSGDVVFHARKPYLVESEENDLQLKYGALADVAPLDLGFAKIGILTSKDAWMPDVVDRLAIQGADTFLQPEAFSGWAIEEQPGDWLPDVFRQSAWSAVQKQGSFRVGVVPHLTGNLFDTVFDGQAAVIVDSHSGEAPAAYIGQDPTGGFLTIAPWVVPDDASQPLDQRRSALRAVGEDLLPGGARDNGYVQTAVAADVDPHAAFPVVASGTGSQALAPSQNDQSYAAAGASGTRVVVAWEEGAQIDFVTSADGGQTFSAPASVAASANAQHTPSVAVTSDHAYVTWQEALADRKVIRLAVSTDFATFGAPVTIDDRAGADDWVPSTVAASGKGTLTAYVASESGNERIRVATTDEAGAGAKIVEADVAPAQPAPNTRNNQWSPSVAQDASGGVTVAWVDFRNYQWDVFASASTDFGATFAPAARVDDGTDAPERLNADPDVVATPAGLVYGWSDVRLRTIPAKARTRNPTAGAAGALGSADPSAFSWRPSLAFVAGATLVAAWQDFRGLENRVYFATSADGGATWSADAPADDPGAGDQQYRPRVVDAGGSALVVWEDTRDGRRQLRYESWKP
jgi:predicted amidohydrolase